MTPDFLRRATALWFGALACAAPAFAQSDTTPAPSPLGGDTLRLNGFGTIAGFTTDESDPWGYRREITQRAYHDDGVRFDADSRLGLQANWRPLTQVEVVGQLVLKSQPAQARAGDAIAWGFAAWHPDADWTVRVGRTSPDLFLLSDVRNVGFAYPWVRPNTEFYSWVPIQNVNGIDVSRTGEALGGRWTAKAFLGKTFATLGSSHDDGDSQGYVRPIGGGTFTFERDGLTLKASYANAHTHTLDPNALVQLRGALDQIAQIPVPGVAEDAIALRDSIPGGTFLTRYMALGAAWDHGPWVAQVEGSRITGNFMTSNAWYGYGSLGYRIGSATVYGMAGRAHSAKSRLPQPQWGTELAPFIGPVMAAQAQALADRVSADSNLYRENQHSLSAGTRYDLGPQLALKVQVDRITSAAFGGGLWAYGDYAAHQATVYSAGLDFVF